MNDKTEYDVGQRRFYDKDGLYLIISSDGTILFETKEYAKKRIELENSETE